MSFRRFSRKFKKSFNRTLTQLAFNIESDSVETKLIWEVLITGGSGHLAECLVRKIEEYVRKALRTMIISQMELTNSEVESHPEVSELVEMETKERMSDHLRIVLLDLIEPKDELLQNDYTTFVKGSFTDLDVMRDALIEIDTVFHLAAVGMTGQYATDRKACMDINAVGTMNLLSWCRQQQVQRFIYSSSIGVIFNGEPLNNVTEEQNHTEKFYNYYCESKAHAETIVQNASCDEIRTAVLRFNGIYGPGEKRVTERVVKFMMSGWWIGLCKPNGIEAQTQLSSVDNCVQGLIKAELALRNMNSKHGQIYNIMDREPVGTFTFWTPLHKVLGFTDFMFNIPSSVLKFGGFVCQNVSDFFAIDPFITLLEVDLLIINNTFSIEKAREELGYDPYPSSMPEIVEMYGSQQTAEEKNQRKQFFFLTLAILGCLFILISSPFIFLIVQLIIGFISLLSSLQFEAFFEASHISFATTMYNTLLNFFN